MAKISVIGICGKSTFMYVDHFHRKGETLSATSVFEEMGGKGINQAIAATRQGADVSFLCAVGDDDSGKQCESLLKSEGINGCVRVKKGENTTMAVILTDKTGENRVTVFRDAELSADDVKAFETEIASSDILLLQNEVPEKVNAEAVKLAEKYGVRVILNPAPPRENVPVNLFMVTPNEQERAYINPEKYENCITTLGGDGCEINGEIRIPAMDTTVVDTTGAGDTFNGVLAVKIAEGLDIARAAEYAVAAASLSVGKKYVIGSIPTREETERKMIK